MKLNFSCYKSFVCEGGGYKYVCYYMFLKFFENWCFLFYEVNIDFVWIFDMIRILFDMSVIIVII